MSQCFHNLKGDETALTCANLTTEITLVIGIVVLRAYFAQFRDTINTIDPIALFVFVRRVTIVFKVIQLFL